MWKIRMSKTPELIKLCILAPVTTLAGILPKGFKIEENKQTAKEPLKNKNKTEAVV